MRAHPRSESSGTSHESIHWLGSARVILLTTLAALMAVGSGCRVVNRFRGSSGFQEAMTFHASFDRGPDADFALGDSWIYHAPAMERWSEAQPGLPVEDGIHWMPEGGRSGGALKFEPEATAALFFRGERNVPWKARNWGGSVSFWLRTDLFELKEGYCDPVQITPRKWNDAAFFVEFERREDTAPFRLGAYADYRVWNPEDREWSDIPPSERPVVTVPGPPFSGSRWTHVVFTWDQFNTDEANGIAVLYLNGTQVAAISGRTQTFTWKPDETRLLLGLGYVGWIDDLSVFSRPLTADEVRQLYQLPPGNPFRRVK